MNEQEHHSDDHGTSFDIAVIGLAGRFPGAATVAEYWAAIREGAHSISHFDAGELANRGVAIDDPDFVAAGYVLDDSDMFDAGFFGYSPREAELTDPQHRVILECAWEAMEDAGHVADTYDGLIGVYVGAGHNTYLLHSIATQPDAAELLRDKQVVLGNRSDFLASRISYKLGLTGPSINIQSACSTSLVAVAEACQSLLAYQCDMALAGGVSIDAGRRDGYVYRPDGIFSPDGYCRTFDARAQGTVGGDGAGIVVLKRLADAIADRDTIYAVIKGAAVNNDGAQRAGFTAPNATTQAEVIAAALVEANAAPESIRYVEVHGSATALGDLIEFSALRSAFPDVPTGWCAVGSVKTNIGHLDSAAGIAGLIKTVLAVRDGVLPPSLHFEESDPRLGMNDSPFYVNTALRPWPAHDGPRRAGVSSFGLGGTNAHLIVEQAPKEPARSGADIESPRLLMLSARTAEELETTTERLLDHLRSHDAISIDDVAFTLRHGRRAFPFRRVLVCADVEEAISALTARDDGRLLDGEAPDAAHRPIAFAFTGFGSQYPGMARSLYATEAAFTDAFDRCADLLEPILGQDIRPPMRDTRRNDSDFRRMLLQVEPSDHPLDRPELGYAVVFALEYALVELWASWGMRPEAMIGHSLGEYVAACVAGVFSLPDALRLVVERARLIEAQGEGAMLAVPLSTDDIARYLDGEVALAAVNSPRSCVVSGTVAGIARVEHALGEGGIQSRRLNTRFAFHSTMMDAVVERYAELVRSVRPDRPAIPFISNLTGTWITDDEATSPDYWARHLRHTVRFADGIATLWSVPDVAVVEVGPSPTLTPDILQHQAARGITNRLVVPSLPGPYDERGDRATLLGAAGRLWLAGGPAPAPADDAGRRTTLPTYPFQRRTYRLGPAQRRASAAQPDRHTDMRKWFSAPSWRRLSPTPTMLEGQTGRSWLIFADETGIGGQLADRLRLLGATVRTVGPVGSPASHDYLVDPAEPDEFGKLAESLRTAGIFPDRVVHCWAVGADAGGEPDEVESLLDRTFGSLVQWAKATGKELMTTPQRWDVVSTGAHTVAGDEPLSPHRATMHGICRVLGQEYPSLTCVHVDLDSAHHVDRLLELLVHELDERTVALRGRHTWVPTHTACTPVERPDPAVRPNGVYLIIGGLGRIGLLMADVLAEAAPVRLVLTSRTGLPPRATWDDPSHPVAVAAAIEAVRALEERGSEVMVAATDVTDRRAMDSLVEQVERRYGVINGVVQCAGTTGAAAHRTIQDLGTEELSWHFGPKVHGTVVLHEVLAGRRLDFAILCSSVASILGGLGFAAYAAANAFLDAFAQQNHDADQPWCAVNWDAWAFSADERAMIGSAVREFALTPEEGRQVFRLLLKSLPQPQIAVSTGDLARRQASWTTPIRDVAVPRAKHERPNLRNPFVAPRSDAEQRVADIWAELLGLTSVGVYDNFFELGGSSLLGLQVVHQLRRELAVAVPLTIVYEGPTVRTLGGLIDELRAAS
ncbi:SDR family NAD(P)-dependent oxidoreductase [Nocardia sp. NPDC051911]|uniref:type I polyketide synthase n=1 Tax=Nocardia sp. NPDC051911 TaxID=3154648 RepID=UPI00341C0439